MLWGMLFGHKRLANAATEGGIEARFVQRAVAEPPRMEAREHRGEWILLTFYAHEDGEFVRAITRVEVEGGRIARLRNYFFTPDVIAEVCAELGLPSRSNGYRWFLPKKG